MSSSGESSMSASACGAADRAGLGGYVSGAGVESVAGALDRGTAGPDGRLVVIAVHAVHERLGDVGTDRLLSYPSARTGEEGSG